MTSRNVRKPVMASAIVVFSVIALGFGQAHAILLSDLLLGDTITVDDKLFSNFEFEFDGGSKPVDTTLIDVTGLPDDPNTPYSDPGLKFTALDDGFGSAALTVDFGDFIDFGFNFTVTVLSPNRWIKDASLELTDFVIGGDGLIQIDDSVFDPSFTTNFGNLFVEADAIFGNSLFDSVEFAPQTTLLQEINIFVDSGFVGDLTGINMFEVRKSQIPEPASLALFGVGLAGLGLVRRRRKAADHAA